MVSNKLVLNLLGHTFKRVEGSLEVTFELLAGLDDVLHDLESLFLADTWSEGEASEVSSNTDTCGNNHLCHSFFKGWAVEFVSVHV